MILDSRQILPDQELAGDVAIVGGGAAGITLARRLGARGHSVLLLESGRFELEPETQDLYRGPAAGPALPAGSEYLTSSRLRYFGGSTNHWGGYCLPLQPMDFEALPWVEHSGWPIGPSDLEGYYPEAAACLGIVPFAGEPLSEEERRGLLLAESPRVRTAIFHMSRPLRFSEVYREEIAASERVRLVVGADVVQLRLAPDGGSLRWLEAASLEGARFTARARYTVVATGGIENARLLLASDSVHPRGIGNGHDLVGRFFIDHPHLPVGDVVLTRPPANHWLYRMWFGPSKKEHGVLCLTEEVRRERRLLNSSVELVPDTKRPTAPAEVAGRESREIVALDSLRRGTGGPDGVLTGRLFARSEQAPNPGSRVRLAGERDAHGMRRVRLDWRLQPRDLATVVETVRIVARELGRAAVGRVRMTVSPEDPWAGAVGGNHHLGTTRMAATPRGGVVDADCRVFGIGDLYVAGSSVFPTGGFANPTFTLVALALRLADHLDRKLADG